MKKKQMSPSRKNVILIGITVLGFLVYTGYKMIAVTPPNKEFLAMLKEG